MLKYICVESGRIESHLIGLDIRGKNLQQQTPARPEHRARPPLREGMKLFRIFVVLRKLRLFVTIPLTIGSLVLKG